MITKLYFFFRKKLYARFTNNKRIVGHFTGHQPVVIRGQGEVSFGKDVSFGVINAPQFYNTYAYIEARTSNSELIFGDHVHVNNAFSIISEKRIVIGSHALIGYSCVITDSNFHDLDPDNRDSTDPESKEVVIEDNVFIGNHVTILKGVTIGKNSVVAAGSVVTKSFPNDVIIGGVPAKIIASLTS